MFYACVRALVALSLRLFYRVKVNAPAEEPTGPVIFVGNHPNGLIDPALVFILTRRRVTFLAKAPLFKMPVIGWLLRGLDALPVYRKQDDPSQMGRNEGTLDAARGALVQGRAITIFPEGKSHSEPGLAELKTGAARIALGAAREGAPVRIVPVGLTYAEKHLFRSEVLIEVGPAIDVAPFLAPEAASDDARQLTERIASGLQAVTLNLEQWEDLALVRTAEQLYAFRQGQRVDPERLRYWARGLRLFRTEQPERFAQVRAALAAFGRRLERVGADTSDLSVVYRKRGVTAFVLKNLAVLCLGLPLYGLGLALFGLPYQVPRLVARRSELDIQATAKFLTSFVIVVVWWAVLTGVAGALGGAVWALVALLGVPVLGLFTLYFSEHELGVLHDTGVFLTLGSRARLKARLLTESERLSTELEKLAGEYQPRLTEAETATPGAR
ncbi:lysophospholipid acyltransferase family protein [Myxococcaceae bacterium GXIMD 01537]